MEETSERVVPKLVEQEMRTSYIDYSMSVIVGRALPNVQDGLKPVHRRILYAMYDLGMFHNKPFKKCARIVGECFVGGTLINSNKGLVKIEDLKRGDKVYTQTGLKKVTELYEMPKRPLLKVNLENGLNNIVTKSQKFKVFTHDFKIVWKKAVELKKGDYIVSKQVLHNIKNEVKLSSNKKLNENIAYLLGFFLSDGWIEKSTGRMGFFSTSKEIINKIQKILKREFDYKVNINKKNGKGLKEGYSIRINKSIIKNFFKTNFDLKNADAYTKKIPRQLFESPKKIIYSFLSGLFDGDGSIHKSRNIIHYGSISNDLIDKLQILMHSKGIYSQRYTNLTSTRILGDRQIKANYPFFSLEISGKNCMNLCKNLKLNETNKRQKLKYIYSSLKKKNLSDNIPFASRYVFKELSKHHVGGGWYKDLNGGKFRLGIKYNNSCKIRYSKDIHNQHLGKEQIIKLNILKKLKLLGSPLAKALDQIIKANLVFIKVKDISDATPEHTYDIQVDNEHEFIANGMISHNCLGKYHPHGDVAVYDSLVRMAQDFSLRYPLIDGQGNFGSVDGDNAAAQRYTEARLQKIAEEMLQDIDKETVEFVPNYDNTLKEPGVLPAKIPNLLINGSSGIAVGMATNIPPHNITETSEAVIKIIENPKIEVKELMQTLKAPDFPTGGIIIGTAGIKEAYETGKGKVVVRARTTLEEHKNKTRIIVTEIPYMVNKAQLIKDIAELVKNRKITEISDLRDESSREGIRVVIELKTGANSDIVLNKLYKHTRLQDSFGINLLALVDNQPKILTLKEIINNFILHRRTIVRKRTQYDLRQAEDKAHILEGLLIALKNIDSVIKLIKQSKATEEARKGLIEHYKITEKQAQAILDMTLKRLTNLEQTKIKNEHEKLIKTIKQLKEILADELKILEIIKKELKEIIEKYGDERRTQIIEAEEEKLEMEQLIKPEENVITITHAGYVKRMLLDVYKQQKRGGKGIIATETKEEDFVENVFTANTHDNVLFFTNTGKVHWLKVYQIPEAKRYAKGTAIVNVLQLSKDEKITTTIPIKEFKKDNNLFMATRKGTVKKTSLEEFSHPRKGGIKAMNVSEGDELIKVLLTDGTKQIMLATANGNAVKFNEKDVREMGRTAAGVRGIKLKGDDKVIGAIIAEDKKTLLTATQKGYGKRTMISDYRLISRGGSGVINIKITEKNGKVVGVTSVTDYDEIMLITQKGILIRVPTKDISVIGRNTQGVRIMKLGADDKLIGITKVKE